MDEQTVERRQWRTIAIPADRAFWSDFKAVALDEEMTVGDAVRAALEQVYGPALARKRAERGARKRELVREGAGNA